ncbi:hypothetical protein PYCCODRAFT_1476423 [Trametes coccinea BRFM310]|uniref:DUF6534 domain-containing protein n=1 Tax=Trametes coccinea (strain BRFM310) TaxID=1353009 RepID=A0A1Y2IUT0_TRAC3|nr:hypothetical protein PYCCODRAFT_1476423 [Trametes coccinea BRFM310]
MSAHDESANPSLDSTLGVELLGFGIALALYGITTAQTVAYIRRYGRPPFPPCMYMVLVLWLIDSVHITALSYSIAFYLVRRRGNPLVFLQPPWTLAVVIIISEINAIIVRFGYAYRIWRYSGRRPLVPCIIAISSIVILGMHVSDLSTLPIGLVFSSEEVHLRSWADGRRFQWTLYTAFSCQIAIDGLIAISMFLVLRQFRTGLKRLDLVITMIIMYAINTGFLTTIGVALSIIFFIVEPDSFIFIGIYFTLPKLYTCSFLGILNAEQRLIQHASSTGPGTTIPVLTSAWKGQKLKNSASYQMVVS